MYFNQLHPFYTWRTKIKKCKSYENLINMKFGIFLGFWNIDTILLKIKQNGINLFIFYITLYYMIYGSKHTPCESIEFRILTN